MYQYHCLNKISPKGTALWTENYQKTENAADADAIMVRSAAMHEMEFSPELKAVAEQLSKKAKATKEEAQKILKEEGYSEEDFTEDSTEESREEELEEEEETIEEK